MKLFFATMFVILFLGGCTPQSSVEPSNSTTSEEQLQEQSAVLQLAKEVERQAVNDSPSQDETLRTDKIVTATNGVAQFNGAGEEVINYRYYDTPDSWILDTARSPDPEKDLLYQVFENDSTFILQLYSLDAYTESPLNGGEVMTEEELFDKLKQDGQFFQEQTKIMIDDQEWWIGYETKEENNTAKLTFFRLENTGNFDDAVIVAGLIFPYNITELSEKQTNLEQTLAYLKDVLYQIGKKTEA